jgi:glyoxylase-like metal-dependent hydrolase (beta-lactamase superfamily II)
MAKGPITWLLGSALGISSLFLVEHRDVLSVIDTGSPATSVGRILRAIRRTGHEPEEVRQIVLTHCHGDHAGQAKSLAEATGATVVAGAADAPVIEGRAPYPGPKGLIPHLVYGRTFGKFARLPVDRTIHEPTELEGGLVAVPTPGHTAGHISVLAPDHEALLIGDTVWHLGPVLPSWKAFTWDTGANAESIRRLAELGVRRILPGHGPVFGGDRLSGLA